MRPSLFAPSRTSWICRYPFFPWIATADPSFTPGCWNIWANHAISQAKCSSLLWHTFSKMWERSKDQSPAFPCTGKPRQRFHWSSRAPCGSNTIPP